MGITQPIRDKEKLQNFRNYYRDIEYIPRNYALIVLGLNTALRISDLLSLRWTDVYRTEDQCYRDHIAIQEQKTGKSNIFPLNTPSLEALEIYRTSGMADLSNPYLFASPKTPGHPISRCQAYRIVKRAADYCQLDSHISCHSLRKTFGYHAWKNGIPPALLMSIYNHSSYDITKHYLCIDQMERDEVYWKTSL